MLCTEKDSVGVDGHTFQKILARRLRRESHGADNPSKVSSEFLVTYGLSNVFLQYRDHAIRCVVNTAVFCHRYSNCSFDVFLFRYICSNGETLVSEWWISAGIQHLQNDQDSYLCSAFFNFSLTFTHVADVDNYHCSRPLSRERHCDSIA